ncbi:MAG: RES family NAD+ phosphorylase [Bacteroidota bacterium]
MTQIYRICAAIHAKKLFASGRANRWNTAGKFVIYAAQSRALACLENVVHRSNIGVSPNFEVMIIEMDEDTSLHYTPLSSLPDQWYLASNYPVCQRIGDAWYDNQTSAVLVVPSSIINPESIYVINTKHPEFDANKIKLVGQEPFSFDPRIP